MYRIPPAGATEAHEAVPVGRHLRQIDEDGARILLPGLPARRLPRRQARMVYPEVRGAEAREDPEEQAHRAQVAAPDPAPPRVDQRDGHGQRCGPAEDQELGPRILVDADELTVDRDADERDERDPAPAHPARDGAVPAEARGPCRQRPLRAEEAAPGAAEEDHREDDEGPPEVPEDELREAHEVGEGRDVSGRRRQQWRHQDDCQIEKNHEDVEPPEAPGVSQKG